MISNIPSLAEFDFTAARGIGDLQKELLGALVLLGPSKDVQNVLRGAIEKAVTWVDTEVELDGHLSEIAATENNQLRDVIVPLLIREGKRKRDEEEQGGDNK